MTDTRLRDHAGPGVAKAGSFRNAPDGPTGLLVLDSLLTGRPDVATDAVWHVALPALCAAIGPAVSIGRVLVDSLAANMAADHARTARSAGMRESEVVLRHAVRNSLGPALSMVGVQAGMLLAGLAGWSPAWPGPEFRLGRRGSRLRR
jgi:peptide/nickel transport system permease protein